MARLKAYEDDPPPYGWACSRCDTRSRNVYPRPKVEELAEKHAQRANHGIEAVRILQADDYLLECY